MGRRQDVRQARRRMRTENGGYRRDHLRALAQRVEVDAKEVRIMGSKSELLRTLVAASSAKTAGFGVPSFVPKWRARRDFELLTPRFDPVLNRCRQASQLVCAHRCRGEAQISIGSIGAEMAEVDVAELPPGDRLLRRPGRLRPDRGLRAPHKEGELPRTRSAADVESGS